MTPPFRIVCSDFFIVPFLAKDVSLGVFNRKSIKYTRYHGKIPSEISNKIDLEN